LPGNNSNEAKNHNPAGDFTMHNQPSIPLVLTLNDASATLEQVGGKGASLARLASAGLPVPPGFYVTTEAYRRFVAEHCLQEKILAAVSAISVDQPSQLEEASKHIKELFTQCAVPDEITVAIRQAYAELGGDDLPVAVRSSATAEDLPEMSFAGQQETYLNMHGEAMVLEAVKRCWASLWTARAIGYRARHGIESGGVSLAVVVQALVLADAAGILFTANPLTGTRDRLVINAAWGLGEAIVGGQVTPDTITFDKTSKAIIEQQVAEKNVMTVRAPEGTHEESVPVDRRNRAVLSPERATELADIGLQIEGLFGQPVDIEWALHDGRFSILQARPITAMGEQAPLSEEWNESLTGDYLWTNGNLGEAVPDVMTPCTWSLIQLFMAGAMAPNFMLGYRPMGNIGGRFYMNLSLPATQGAAIGMSRKFFLGLMEQVFGHISPDMEIPLMPISRWRLLGALLPTALRLQLRVRANMKRLPSFLAAAPARCAALRAQIQAASSPQDLITLWHADLWPFFQDCNSMLEASTRQEGGALLTIRRELSKLVGETDANVLFSGLSSGQSYLASLEPLLGLTRLARGEIDHATFARLYGHRSPHEFEVSIPRPAEDPDWIERQLAGLREAPVDVMTLLARQQEAQKSAWERFRLRYPRQEASMRRRVERAAAVYRDRESARSEVMRVFWVLRTFVLQAGVLTGQGDDLFFLSIDEILAVLGGDSTPFASIPARRATYQRCAALPPYPSLIRGHFDPFRWAADPQRRSDVFDARGQSAPPNDALSGFPGAPGIVEGLVRVILTPEDGDQLQAGEILVTTVTNVGWTLLFPRAAAVVTDIGAPLSHAAIVARELGIPAVVGCGNATTRLHTGDRVRVDGGQGTVELLPMT
jgi:rifampicin phosphotransferase